MIGNGIRVGLVSALIAVGGCTHKGTTADASIQRSERYAVWREGAGVINARAALSAAHGPAILVGGRDVDVNMGSSFGKRMGLAFVQAAGRDRGVYGTADYSHATTIDNQPLAIDRDAFARCPAALCGRKNVAVLLTPHQFQRALSHGFAFRLYRPNGQGFDAFMPAGAFAEVGSYGGRPTAGIAGPSPVPFPAQGTAGRSSQIAGPPVGGVVARM